MTTPIADTSKLAIHTITVKPMPFERMVEKFTEAGVSGITVWPDNIESAGTDAAAQILADSPLQVCALARGGFFPAKDAAGRASAIDLNKQRIDMAYTLGAPVVVLVCGAVPGQSLDVSREQIVEGIEAILPYAQQAGIKLAIEPLHPMYADDRSAINTLETANGIAEQLAHPHLGVCVDVYHCWWDPNLEAEIQRAGAANRLFAFHICDWRTPTRNLYTDRGLMGEGCINIPEIRGWMERAGFDGMHEVEIFSDHYWALDQDQYVDAIAAAYKQYV